MAPVAEVEVGADDDEPGTEPADEHLAHEVLGRLLAPGLVEGEDARRVEVAGRVEQLQLLVERREQLRRRLGAHDLGRVAVEGQAARLVAAGDGELAHDTQHLLVAEVHAVVRADRDHRTGRGRVVGGEIRDDAHASARPRRRARRPAPRAARRRS